MAQRTADGFEARILPHLDDAYTLARHLLGDEHDAQDAVQDAALRAFRHFAGFRGDNARAWLLAIVRNCCLTMRQGRAADRVTVPFADQHLSIVRASDQADSAAIAQSERALVEQALAEMPVEFREVLVLREVQGLSYAEISDIVGVPAGTVMSRLSRARRRLATKLGMTDKEAS
jgi:RNA polymerase sigma-70 factor (ECF subfamily)